MERTLGQRREERKARGKVLLHEQLQEKGKEEVFEAREGGTVTGGLEYSRRINVGLHQTGRKKQRR